MGKIKRGEKKMEIKILAKTQNFARMIWTAGKTCKSLKTPSDLYEESMDIPRDKLERFAKALIKSGHLSVLEHCTITYSVENVSRSLLAQYSRHRIGVSLSVQSQRFAEPASFVPPTGILKISGVASVWGEAIRGARKSYQDLINLGVPREDARSVLPNASSTNFVTTVNLRSLIDLYQKRVIAPGAQSEIRQMIQTMWGLVCEAEPWLKDVSAEPPQPQVDHPDHYTDGGVEPIDLIDAKQLSFSLGNAVKYIARAGRKGSKKEDLQKAIWYLKHELTLDRDK